MAFDTKTKAPAPSPIKARELPESKESHFLPQTSINVIQTPKASAANFFRGAHLKSQQAKKSGYSQSKKERQSPLPSRSLQNSSKRQRTETSSKSLAKEKKNIFENSLYGRSESNNKLSLRNRGAPDKDNTPSLGHTQRSVWARPEAPDPTDFIERAKGFNGRPDQTTTSSWTAPTPSAPT